MDKLLKIATQMADQAEVFYLEDSSDGISFTDSKLETADTQMSSGVALRVIKDGKIGLAYTRNLLDKEGLVRQALLSASNGMEVNIKLPHTTNIVGIEKYDPEIETLSKQELIGMCKKQIEYVRKQLDAQFNLSVNYGTSQYGIKNSAGTELDDRLSGFGAYANLVFPGTGAGIMKFVSGKSMKMLSTSDLDEMIELFKMSKTEIVPATKALPVIFSHQTLYTFLSRFGEAYNPINIHNGISPLCHRIGEKVLSEEFSLYQDPFDSSLSNSSGFDAEGMPTQKLHFFENGVFKTIPTDLNYADKLKLQPSGNAVRSSIETLPRAGAINQLIAPGNKTLEDMIASIDEGIIAFSLMGGHSGNVLNGDYSVGVSSGFMIKGGKLIGRVKDCMLSGNVYDDFQRIVSLESTAHIMGSRKLPAIMIDGVKVAGK